ncbi:CBP4-domain-containing protein [Decorospora gaudefroyi]|uniref:Cytochrome b mRNA-processing protein 4 n=1 Tax=Decorospora gaudefroyi TaxID=184978 RepID=A0A6A5K0E2_9PLEO|nr:CBP4-domain-containing protein [Decorospora gaudefroyi]
MPSPRAWTWIKASAAGLGMCIGGPALVMYVSPTEEELFKRYNPELQKKSLANRYQRQKDFDDFVCGLKEASKSDKPIWTVQKEMAAKRAEEDRERRRQEYDAHQAEVRRKQAEVRESAQ